MGGLKPPPAPPSARALSGKFEICFRCLVLLEKISFDKIFEAATQKFAIRCKLFWYNNFLSEPEKMKFKVHKL